MRSVEEILTAWGDRSPESLIPLLQQVQEAQGYVPRAAMTRLAAALGMPVARVYGVATFYNQFRFTAPGEHIIEICRGTACHVRGSAALLDHLRRRLKVDAEGNSRDGRFTLSTGACLGACSLAPVIRLDGEFYGGLTIEKLDQLLDAVGQQPRPAATAAVSPVAAQPAATCQCQHQRG